MTKDDEDCEIKKPQMKNVADEEQIKDLAMNKIMIFDLQMSDKSMRITT